MFHALIRASILVPLLIAAGCTDLDVPAPSQTAFALSCTSPLTLPVDAQAEARARLELQALAPGATLEWSRSRGTLSRVANLELPLPACTGSENAYDHLLGALERSPALFQIDRAEWRADPYVSCSSILQGGAKTLVLRRTAFGPYPQRRDVFSAVAARKNGGVVLRLFMGTYVPTPTPELLAAIESCSQLPVAQLEATLRAQPFVYTVFAAPPAPMCSFDRQGAYSATDADTLTIHPGVELEWDEDFGGVTLRLIGSATLRVAPADHTPELQRSDANCPDDANRSDVGWIRAFDAVTGQSLGDKPNPVPGCSVC